MELSALVPYQGLIGSGMCVVNLKKGSIISLVVGVILFLVSSGSVLAQTPPHIIVGVVKDSTGNVIESGRITAWLDLNGDSNLEQISSTGLGEGGKFTLTGDQLVLTHRYHLSAGEAIPGLAASELRMVARGPDTSAPEEPCQVIRNGNRLQLNFPSGNAMTFNRPAGVR